MRLILIAFLPIFLGCASKPDTAAVEAQTNVKDSSESLANLPGQSSPYTAELEKLPMEISSSKVGLDMFANRFQSDDKTQNDRSLKDYLEFQSKLIDSLNENLVNDPRYDAIESMIYEDSTKWEYGRKKVWC